MINRDTVSSVGLVMSRSLPFVEVNTTIRVFRQALALDEVRRHMIARLCLALWLSGIVRANSHVFLGSTVPSSVQTCITVPPRKNHRQPLIRMLSSLGRMRYTRRQT